MGAPPPPADPRPVRRALVSVSDKSGIIELAQVLTSLGVEILSTGGSAETLSRAGVPVTCVSDYTGFPEIMGGRVKTLHPKIHGGLLGREQDTAIMAEHGIAPIDLLVLNLYPFEHVISNSNCTLDEAIENIDIGGPAMLRAAAKNFERVAVVTDPSQYSQLISELKSRKGALTRSRRFDLAQAAFKHVSHYDSAVSAYLSAAVAKSGNEFPEHFIPEFIKVADLRYGENPHQKAAFYKDSPPGAGTFANFRQLQGKALSYNNIADADAAWECARGFAQPVCVIVKHANPCGVAVAEDPQAAYERAYAADPASAFGGIIAFNRPVAGAAAARILERQFVEVLLAPRIAPQARAVLAAKVNVRLLEVPEGDAHNDYEIKRIGGGVLVQSADTAALNEDELAVATRRAPSAGERADMAFAWQVVRSVKSNAIVYARGGQTIGIGAGQMSRVDAARIAVMKAGDAGLPIKGAVMASDAFLPFRDSVDEAAKAGVTAIIQPGGSRRDREVAEAADEHDIAMVFTGVRHFRH